jgi:hypothetical protein
MFTATIDRFRKRLRTLALKVVIFQIEMVFTKDNPFRHNLVALASTTASCQFNENINHAATGEYTLAIYRHTLGSDYEDGEGGEDVKALITNLLHAVRYRGLDANALLEKARWMFDAEVQDEMDELGNVEDNR